MNILYVSDSNTLSGAEVVLLQHVTRFGPPHHRSHVFLRDQNPRLIAALAQRGVSCTPTAAYPSRILETTANPAALLDYARAFRHTTREMVEVIRTTGADLVHSVSYPASLHAALAARRAGVPHIWHDHNIKRKHALNGPLYRFVASTCTWVIGPSDAVTTNLSRFGIPAAKLRTVYNGIDLARFVPDDDRARRVRQQLGLSPTTFVVGLFGQMLAHKGHATLIGAARLLAQQGVTPAFLFVGALENPPYEAELRARLEADGLRDAFTFTGWRQDVHDVISAVDVAVVATTTPEPAALSLMETMAMGRPIVATQTGGTAELVADGETGLLFPPGDELLLARHLARLHANPDERVSMGATGRARVEARFSQARHLDELEDLYQAAIARR